ncbi:hypothetical protein BJ875DRAFT_83836 [Amylocarpus encephaloides]|uniref:SMP-30/Gluconolactonase/LRE-like region domain-containing protein n=1 Tax=Amylocarpus encephaloides TaxID=45428 RepID=A0A9P8CAJ1_9HELO|nr:hypothetical protein BJ875DRAFT_83836 [Amylocarpus encephaloides]
MSQQLILKNGGDVWHTNNPANRLGESPIYRSIDSTLHWTDIHATPCTIQILKIEPRTGDVLGPARILEVPFDPITVIRFRRDVPGSYICGYKKGIAFLSEESGEVEVVKELLKEDETGLTMNDGGVDPQGRFWIGSVDLEAIDAQQSGKEYGEPRGKLWRYSPDGSCTIMESGVMIGNGMCWSPDGKYMFYNDSGPQAVWRYDFDSKTGDISNKTIMTLDGLPKGVMNDGMINDESGNLWIAMWMMHSINVCSPEGALLQTIEFPARCITCPTWGGENNDILFVASAQPIVEKAAPGDQGGHMFRYKPEGVKGMPTYEFAG